MARLLIVAEDPLLLTSIYRLLEPAGYTLIETTTSATTALGLLHTTPHQYTVLAQVDARSYTGYPFADLLEMDYEVRSRHAFVLFTSLPKVCLPPATIRLGYALLSLPFHSEDLLDALLHPLIVRPKRPSIPLAAQDIDASRLAAALSQAHTTEHPYDHDGANGTDPSAAGYSSLWAAGDGSIEALPGGNECMNSRP
jgi:ActR/RegA family two-component response regulator